MYVGDNNYILCLGLLAYTGELIYLDCEPDFSFYSK